MSPLPLDALAHTRAEDAELITVFGHGASGDKDLSLVQEGARASAARMPHAKVETIAGGDHLLQMEHPAKVNKLLVDYISLNGTIVNCAGGIGFGFRGAHARLGIAREAEAAQLRRDGHTPLDFPGLRFVKSREESQRLNERGGIVVRGTKRTVAFEAE